jgi:crotonyl-CoA reductase
VRGADGEEVVLDVRRAAAAGDDAGRVVRKDEVDMFEGVASEEKDPRKSLHIDEVPIPPLGPNEVLIAPMASALNYNTVWTSIFEPLPTFGFLERFGKESELGARHDLPYHIVGSDAAGVVLRTGPGVTQWKPGDRVTVHCNYVDLEGPAGHEDSMLDPDQRIWGFETNFGSLADISMVKANQLMPMPDPPHLGGGGVARPGAGDLLPHARRRERGPDEAGRRRADLGRDRRPRRVRDPVRPQRRRHPGRVVSSPEKAELLRSIGVEHVIDRKAEGYRFETRRDARLRRRSAASARRSGSSSARTPTSSSSTRAATTFGASVSSASGAARS